MTTYNIQITEDERQLIVNALEILSPDDGAAAADAAMLCLRFEGLPGEPFQHRGIPESYIRNSDVVTPGDWARTPQGTGPGRTTIYRGRAADMGGSVTWQREGEKRISSLNPRLDIRNHSPTGFAWGYAGSGPSQLALALALHVLDDVERAVAVYQRLKTKLIAELDQYRDWEMSGGFVLETIQAIEDGRA